MTGPLQAWHGLLWRTNVNLGASINPGGCKGECLWPGAHSEPPIPPCQSLAQGMCLLLLNVARVSLTHTGCAVFIGFIATIASFIGPAPVASIGVDTHRFVSRAYKWELDAFIGVCKARGPLTRDVWAVCPSLGSVCPLICGPGHVPCWASLSLLQCPWTVSLVLNLCILGELRLGPRSLLYTTLSLDKLFIHGWM